MAAPAGRAWGRPDVTPETSNRDIYHEQSQIIREQDDSLDAMYDAMKRTKSIAIEIGKEADEHIGLLDEMDSKVAKNTARIKNASRQVEDVQVESSTKCLWLFICLLFAGVIVTTILAFKL